MVEKIKMDVNRLLFVLKVKKKFPIYFAKIELFTKFKIKTSLSASIFIFSTIITILKRKFYVLRNKHVET